MFKQFTPDTVLTAEDVNDYLMEQTVMVFANASARSAAVTTPLEGMTSYLQDVDSYEVYTGAAWIPNTSYGAWKSWTPTLGGTGWALGNGTVLGVYTQIGKTIIGEARITFGTTSTAGTVSPTITLPVARKTAPFHIGRGAYTVGTSVYDVMGMLSSSIITLSVTATNGLRAALSSTVPAAFVAASTTVLQANFIYEAA